MRKSIKRSIIKKLLKIGEIPEASIIEKYAKEEFSEDFQKLLDDKVLIHFKILKEIEVADGDLEYIAELQRKDGKNMYFSPADGWVAVSDDDITLYKINFQWLLKKIMDALGVADHHTPKEILEKKIWTLRPHRIEKQIINLIIIRNAKNDTVFDVLINYLNDHHNPRNPALVVALDQHLPGHLKLPNQNELMKIDDVIRWDKDNFEINTTRLAEKMGGTISKPGFSNGYRTFKSNGITYAFTKLQSEALEFMDGKNKAIHQTEILSETISQERYKLRALFKKGGKVHGAWGAIIKSDRKGNYWLDY